MKIICAWCHKLIAYQCPACGGPLTDPDPSTQDQCLVCRSEIETTSRDSRKTQTQIYYALDKMVTAEAICPLCYAKLEARSSITRTVDVRAHEVKIDILGPCQVCRTTHQPGPCPPTQQTRQESPPPPARHAGLTPDEIIAADERQDKLNAPADGDPHE